MPKFSVTSKLMGLHAENSRNNVSGYINLGGNKTLPLWHRKDVPNVAYISSVGTHFSSDLIGHVEHSFINRQR